MDDALHELTTGWIAKASADWKTAERLEPDANERDYDAVLLGSAAFHLQQSAEKSLKAFLTAKSVRFTKIHDLSRLLGLAASVDSTLSVLSDAAELLAPFAVEVRYPGDWDELSASEYGEVKRAAEGILQLVGERLGVSIGL